MVTAIDPADLSPGEKFIWANQDTRNYMCVNHYDWQAHVLRFDRVEERSGGHRVYFYNEEDDSYLWYEPGKHHVVRVEDLVDNRENWDLECSTCGHELHEHGLMDLECPGADGGTFWPEIAYDDFFASLGL